MNIALRLARWFLAAVISTSLAFWIFAATINATVANRDVVKSWLAASGSYGTALSSLFQVSTNSEQNIVKESAQESFSKTFDGGFVRQGTETVVDATYDWAEGKKDAITFSVPVNEKEAEFFKNMNDVLTPKLRALPACATRVPANSDDITCLPVGIDASTFASQLARPSASGDAFLKEPLTQNSFKDVPSLPWIPGAVQALHASLWSMPLTIIVCGVLYVLASPDRLRGVSHVARRLTIGAAIPLIGGAFIWFTSTSINLSSAIDASDPAQTAQQQAIVNNIMNPIARTVLPSIGQALTLYSGIVVVLAGATWLGVFIWRHKRGSGEPTLPKKQLANHQPPVAPHEQQLPPPTAKP